jgi:hypothetical protein
MNSNGRWLVGLLVGTTWIFAQACGQGDSNAEPSGPPSAGQAGSTNHTGGSSGTGNAGTTSQSGGNTQAGQNGSGGQSGTSGTAGTTGTGTAGTGTAGSSAGGKTDPHAQGEYQQWHTLTWQWSGPESSESDSSPNPFLDYRMWVEFTSPKGTKFRVPGFFNGDGKGGGKGSIWRAYFVPNEVGTWTYQVSFRSGNNVAINDSNNVGTMLAPDGESGSFDIGASNKALPDFRARGRVSYTGDHYFHTENGAIWIKGGSDSPENFLGYAGFDNTEDQPGGAGTTGLQNGLHRYQPHVKDWKTGDPDWNNGAGKGIIGALNYLASEHVNSIYFLPCNLFGDGRDTYPYLSPDDLQHWDLSKLQQWEQVLNHAEHHGIALHVVLNETENGNENLHDNGTLGPDRKLYYRELIARIAHHQGLFWNLGEENDYGTTKQIEFASYIRKVDPYHNPITVHTHANQPGNQYNGLLGNPNFEFTSIQLSPNNANQYTEEWVKKSEDAGRPWVVMLDEIGPAGTGVTDTNSKEIRKLTLWPAYLSGAGGVEWYFGYHDLPLGGDMRVEDFRTRKDMWHYTWVARQFVEALPLSQMKANDGLVGSNGAQAFFKQGEVYAIYLPQGGNTTLDLSKEQGSWQLRWYNVNEGTYGDSKTIQAGSKVSLGTPGFGGDVAAVIKK